ncbi:MAG: GHKL domain-containing protein [Lachnospiraceae bacterium]|nr:GHKL domain-containing protein [Lachnospiraceae bacterium]
MAIHLEHWDWILSSVIIIIFASITMYYLADVHFSTFSPKKKIFSIIYFITYLTFNVIIQIILGPELYGDFYILFAQIPLYILLTILTRYRGIKLVFLYLSITIFSSAAIFLSSFIIFFTKMPLVGIIPSYSLMLFVCYHYLRKPFYYILEYAETKLTFWLTLIPILYYIYNYSTTKYQYFTITTNINRDFWLRGTTLVIVLISYCTIILFFRIIRAKSDSDMVQEMISQQLHDATAQIEQLRFAEKQAALYRHDMRHHFNYINSCIIQNNPEEATKYIQQIFDVFDDSKIIPFSSNESLNLIFSSFYKEATEHQIHFTVNATANDFIRFSVLDLCKLLYNGIENALNACKQVENPRERFIHIELYEKNNKLCCEIRNSYAIEPHFNESGIPISTRNNHGIGVKSMVYVVNKYHGVYKFSAKDNQFTFQMCI